MSKLRYQLAADDAQCAPKRQLVARLSTMLNTMPDTAPAIVAGGYVAASSTIATELEKARAGLQSCEGAVGLDRQLIADAEEEARRLSVLPGWLR
jgi:hypothetical protein